MNNNNNESKSKTAHSVKLKNAPARIGKLAKLNNKFKSQQNNDATGLAQNLAGITPEVKDKTSSGLASKILSIFNTRRSAFLLISLLVLTGAILIVFNKNIPKTYTEGYYFKELNIDLDPLKTDTVGANQIALNLLFLPLTRQNHQGVYESSILDINLKDDGKTYSLKYKNQLKWSDGKNVDIEDLSFTLSQFIKNNSLKSGYQSFKGATVVKINDNEISLTLSEPDIDFAKHLNQIMLAPKHNYAINADSVVQSDAEIYGGPYIYRGLNIIDGGLEIKLSANNNYSNFGKITNKRVNLRFFDSKLKLVDSFNRGFISASPQLDSLEVDSFIGEYFYQTPSQVYAFFNTTRITDSNLRRALAYSINEKDIASQVKRVDNPSLLNKYQLSQSQDGGSLGFNKDEATKLFDQSGYKNNNGSLVKSDTNASLRFKIVALDDQVSSKTASLLAEQLRSIGIAIDLSFVSAQEFKEEQYVSHDYDILINSIDMGIKPDIKTYWSSDQPNRELNFSNLSDSKLEGLIFTFNNSSDQAQKEQALLKFSQGWTAIAPAKPLYVQPLSLVSRYKISSTGDNTAIDIQDYLSKIPYFRLESE
jgi:peptide/nickel transport system substrate-binding protein